jgi:hypothetical protein
MTEQTQTPPAWQPPEGADPKAAAKAAKAYAKASRPWYKKKRWIGTIVIVAFIAIAAASGGGSSDDDSLKSSSDSTSTNTKSDSKQSKNDSSGKVGSKGNPAPRGTAVQNKSAKYTIDNVEVRDSLGQFADKPSGKYVVVTLTAENVKDETIQISSEDFKLLVGGVEIDASDEAYMLDDAFSYDDLSPGLKRSGKVVFDVAPKDAGNGVLQAQALLSTDDPIYLKLK